MSGFGIQKSTLFGTHGEFTVDSANPALRAYYVLTKIRPGTDGNWENELASHMVPWRESFRLEDMTFDELVQRDLDDSRVAHDLIPYLIGKKDISARFFPPILAILVPNDPDANRIRDYYPKVSIDTPSKVSFEPLFDFEKLEIEGQLSPLAQLRYVRQQSRFIIVDGQHRAMAILALHRQLNSSWGSDRYSSYYSHIDVDAAQIKQIELPVCIVFFPDFHEDNTELKQRGLTLTGMCREIFLVVNKTAKKVSQERELLLDDDDFAARMMRRTLSALKGRGEKSDTLARIYSFAYGDSTERNGGSAVSGEVEYSSAVCLHKIHAATSFGPPLGFALSEALDITDGRRLFNTYRPSQLLLGTELSEWPSLSRTSARSHGPEASKVCVELLGDLAQIPLLKLFDEFRPFSVLNQQLRKLRTRLQDPTHRADPIQNKVYTLLFEGSGVLSVFEDHKRRLKETQKELEETGGSDAYITNQLSDSNSVTAALDKHLDELRFSRSATFFQIDAEKFAASASADDQQTLNAAAKWIFATASTQAFQIGYSMSINALVETFLEDHPNTPYSTRMRFVEFVCALVVETLNAFFSPKDSTRYHKSLAGLVLEKRIGVFNPGMPGLRQLLKLSGVSELNERQWDFFKYVVFEIIFSEAGMEGWPKVLDTSERMEVFSRKAIKIWDAAQDARSKYIQRAVEKATGSGEFFQQQQLRRASLQGGGKAMEEIEDELEVLRQEKAAEVRRLCDVCVEATTSRLFTREEIMRRIVSATSQEESGDVGVKV